MPLWLPGSQVASRKGFPGILWLNKYFYLIDSLRFLDWIRIKGAHLHACLHPSDNGGKASGNSWSTRLNFNDLHLTRRGFRYFKNFSVEIRLDKVIWVPNCPKTKTGVARGHRWGPAFLTHINLYRLLHQYQDKWEPKASPSEILWALVQLWLLCPSDDDISSDCCHPIGICHTCGLQLFDRGVEISIQIHVWSNQKQ